MEPRIVVPGGRAAPRAPRAMSALLLAVAPLAAVATGPAGPGDAAAGARAFQVCVACHSVERDGPSVAGPNLFAIVGRDVASAPGFVYSEALRLLPGTWDAASLDRFLANPAAVAPGTRMVVRVADARQRADLVAYLATLGEGSAGRAATPAPDFGPGWPAGPGRAEAGRLCSACHSLAIVKQQRLPRERWREVFESMIADQGMTPQPADQRALVLDYLATHFGPPP